MSYEFVLSDRLGIPLPVLEMDWEDYSDNVRSDILYRWEQIRGTIPDRVKALEKIIIAKQNQLDQEDDFIVSCALNSEIAELAGTINELHIWFRINQEMDSRVHH